MKAGMVLIKLREKKSGMIIRKLRDMKKKWILKLRTIKVGSRWG